MRTLFHITTNLAWQKAQEEKVYQAPSLKQEGFIHLSRPHQVLATGQRFFSSAPENLLLLSIATERLIAPVKYEIAEGEKFPHLYGPLNLDAVLRVDEFCAMNGHFVLPPNYSLVEKTLIRPGLLGDEAEISNVHIHSWQETYHDLMPKKILQELPLTFFQRQNAWHRGLKNKTNATFVAESENHGIIAFVSCGFSRDQEFQGYGEIFAIYTLKAYQGKGIGRSLIQKALGHLQHLQCAKAYLWVLKGNPTLDFYLKSGGKLTGKQKEVDLENTSLIEQAVEWDLSSVKI